MKNNFTPTPKDLFNRLFIKKEFPSFKGIAAKAFLVCMLLLMFVCTGRARTITSQKTGNWDSTSTWQNGIVPTNSQTTDSVIIAAGDTVTVSSTDSITDVTINSSGILTINSSVILYSGGNLTVNGNGSGTGALTGLGEFYMEGFSKIISGTGTITVTTFYWGNEGPMAKTISSGSNLTFKNASASDAGLTNNGTVTFTGLLSGTGHWTQGTNAKLIITGATPTISNTTFTATGDTVEYSDSSNTIKGTAFYNLIINESGTATLSGATTVTNLTIAGGKLDPGTNNYGLTISGNLVNNGTLVSRSAKITFSGAAAQTISGTATSFNLDSLVINNSAGVSLSASSGDSIISAGLTLTSGVLSIGNNIYLYKGTTGTLSAGSATSYISFLGSTGGFCWQPAANPAAKTTVIFPTGIAGSIINGYRPVEYITSAAGGAVNFKVGFIEDAGGSTVDSVNLPGGTSNNRAGYIAMITPTTPSSGYGLSLSYNNSDFNFSSPLDSNVVFAYWNGSESIWARAVPDSTIGSSPYVIKADTVKWSAGPQNITLLDSLGINAWTGAVSTDWGTGGNWSTGAAPASVYSNVIIPSAPSNQPVLSAGSLTINSIIVNGTLTITGVTLTVSSTFTVNGTVTGTGALSLTGNGASIYGTGTVSTGHLLLSAAGSQSKTIMSGDTLLFSCDTVSITGASTITNNGVVTISGTLAGTVSGSAWINAANATLNIGGALLPTGSFTASATSNTVNYNGASQMVIKGTYYKLGIAQTGSSTAFLTDTTTATNLTVTGGTLRTGTKKLTCTTTAVSGTLLIDSAATTKALGTVTYPGSSGLIHIKAGATVTTASLTIGAGNSWRSDTAAAAVTISGDLTVSGSGSFTNSAATTYSISGNVSVDSSATFTADRQGKITLTGAAKTIGGTVTALYIPYLAITGSYTNTISTVGLTVDSTLSGAGTLTMATNAILKLGGTSSVASSLTNLNCTSNTPNTVIYYGSAPTLKGYTYYDLIVSPGGTATFSSYSTQTVNHNLYVTTSTLDGTSAYLTVMDSTILTGEFDVNSAMHIKAFGDLWIKNGGTLGIGVADTVVTMNNLTVDSGGYYWSAGTAAEITITGNVTINGIFTNIVASTYNISGNFANNATTFSAGTGTYTFNGTSSATVSGNDSTAFTNLVIDKDSAAVADTGRIVEFTNRYMGVSGTLTITSGTLKLSNSAHTKLSQSTYSIPSGGGLWLNSSNDSLVATSTGTGSSNSGLFRVTSGTYNNSISSTTQSFTTNSGALTEINGGAVNIGAGFNNSGTVKITGGTMTVGYGATSSSNALFASQSGSTLTMTGGTVAFQNANSNSAGDLFLSSGVSSITGGTLQIGATSTPASSTFHLNASNAGAIYNLTINSTNNPTFLLNTALTIDGSITNNSTGGMNANGNTVTLNGSATQNITGTKATSFYNLTVNNSAGVNLSGSVNSTVNDTLALTSGLLSTNSDTVILPSTAIITTTGGYVSGNLQRAFDATHKSQLFVIGDVNNHYTPVTVAFGSISTAGTFTARATAGNDPQVSSSGIDSLHSVNTYWQLTNNGIVFDTANATFNWPTGDVDAGSMTGDFVVGKYNSSSWLQPSLANSDSISVQAAALTSFGGIQIGQYCGSISLSSAAGTNAQTLCLNAALTPITYVVGGTITGSSVTGLPAGVTGSLSGGVYTISGTPTVSSGSPYSYTVTLGITGSCSAATASGTITVNPLPSAIISSSTNVEDCSGYGKNGAASVHASGGAGASPYTYSWSPSGGTDSTAGSLTAGIYMATVTDANGCSATTANDTIIQLSATCPDTLKLKFFIQGYYQGSGIMNPTLLYVAFDLGTDTADLLDKTDTVFVELHDPASVATAAQTYRGIVHTDGTLQCYFPDSVMNHAYYIVIKHRSALETWSAVPVTITDTAVSYDFTTDSTKAYGNNMTDEYGEGIWSFYTGDVTDSTGIESFASKDGVIDMYDYLDVQTDYQLFLFGYYSTDINGDGAVEGEDYGLEEENAYYGYAVMRPGSVTCTMTVTATTDSIIRCYGGTTSVTVSASSAYGDVFGATSHTGVAAGIHTYTLMDSYGCISSANDTVTQPTALTASISSSTNVSCYGGSTGAATVSVSGGTTSYTYSWTSGATTATASSLAAGTYTVTVTDAHSCTATATVTITQPSSALSASITSSTNVSCYGASTGSATVSASGGTTAYTYSWSPSGGTNATASSLAAGTYTITVTDAHGCTATATATVALVTNYTWNGSVSTDWNTPSNWTPHGIPTSCDTVTIVSGSNNSLLNSNVTVNTLIINSGILNIQSYSLSVTNDITLNSSGILNAAANNANIYIGGSWSNNGTFLSDTSTVTFNGSVTQIINGSAANIFNNLTINNSGNNISLSQDITVNHTLLFTLGNIVTNTDSVIIASTGSVNGAGSETGWVNGKLQMPITTGNTTVNFPVGDSTIYAPVSIDMNHVTVAGNMTAFTKPGNDPNENTPASNSSHINQSAKVNRFWHVGNSGVVLVSYGATFHFAQSESTGDTTYYLVSNFSSYGWSFEATGGRTSASIQAEGITTFGDFEIGNLSSSVGPGSMPSIFQLSTCDADFVRGVVQLNQRQASPEAAIPATGLSQPALISLPNWSGTVIIATLIFTGVSGTHPPSEIDNIKFSTDQAQTTFIELSANQNNPDWTVAGGTCWSGYNFQYTATYEVFFDGNALANFIQNHQSNTYYVSGLPTCSNGNISPTTNNPTNMDVDGAALFVGYQHDCPTGNFGVFTLSAGIVEYDPSAPSSSVQILDFDPPSDFGGGAPNQSIASMVVADFQDQNIDFGTSLEIFDPSSCGTPVEFGNESGHFYNYFEEPIPACFVTSAVGPSYTCSWDGSSDCTDLVAIGCYYTFPSSSCGTAALSVSVSPSNPTICSGGAGVTLAASGATSFSWFPSTGLSCTTCASPVATPSVTTTYVVTGTGGGCTANLDVTVIVIDDKTLSISGPTAACDDDYNSTFTYTVLPFDANFTYSWVVDGGTPSTGTGQSMSVDWTGYSGGTITVTLDDGCNNPSATLNVQSCCTVSVGSGHDPNLANTTSNDSYFSNSDTYSGADIVINGTFTVNRPSYHFTFSNVHIYFGPGASIIIPPGYTLTIDHCILDVCTDMWEGIVVQSSGNTIETGGTLIVKNNSQINNAQYAIEADDYSNISVSGCTFNEDYVGIYVPPSLNGSYNYVNFNKVTENVFTAGSYSGRLAIPYFEQTPPPGTIAYAGIEVNNLSETTLPGTITTHNTFSYLKYGIISNSSYINVNEAVFSDLYFYGTYASGGGSSRITNSSFTSCSTGIYANSTTVKVSGVNMTSVNEGIAVVNGTNQYISLQNNTIQAGIMGVSLLSCEGSIGTFVEANHINMQNIYGPLSCGINVQENGPSNPSSLIQQNVINMAPASGLGAPQSYGINISNASDYVIQLNNINYSTIGTSPFDYGINVNFNFNTSLFCNSVIGTAAAQTTNNQFSINSTSCTGYYYKCNTIDKTYDGFCYNLTNLGILESNYINNHTNGLHVTTGFGTMNPQTNEGNLWLGAYLKWGALDDNTSGAGRQPIKYNSILSNGNVPPASSFSPPDWFVPIGGIEKDCGTGSNQPLQGSYCTSLNPSVVVHGIGSSIGFSGGNQYQALIAQDSIHSTNYDEQTVWNARMLLMEVLQSDTTGMSADTSVVNFYNAHVNDNIGKLSKIRLQVDAINSADSTTMAAIQSNFNIIDSNALLIAQYDSVLVNDTTLSDSVIIAIDSLIQIYNSNIAVPTAANDSIHNMLQTTINSRVVAIKNGNDTLISSLIYEQNEIAVNSIYLGTVAIGQGDSVINYATQLYNIASQCPATGGPAVFHARSLYALINDTITYSDDRSCLSPSDTCLVPPTPGIISGQSYGVCGQHLGYSVDSVSATASYTWSVTGIAGIDSGQGTTEIWLSFPDTFSTGTINVYATDSCGSGGVRTLIVSGRPAAPSSITGSSGVCTFASEVPFSIDSVASATSYTWVVPAGCTIDSGQGSTRIVVDWDSLPGNVKVAVSNACGTSDSTSHFVDIVLCRTSQAVSRPVIGGVTSGDVKIYPNPTTGSVTVIYHLNSDKGVLQLYDMVGRLMGSYHLDGNKNAFQFDASYMCCGIFQYVVSDNETIVGEGRLVILR